MRPRRRIVELSDKKTVPIIWKYKLIAKDIISVPDYREYKTARKNTSKESQLYH